MTKGKKPNEMTIPADTQPSAGTAPTMVASEAGPRNEIMTTDDALKHIAQVFESVDPGARYPCCYG